MATFIKMPRLGLTMTEGTIVKWFKNEGDQVEKGEKILEIESDKSVVPFESPEAGVLLKIMGKEGDVVECQTDIAVLGEPGEDFSEQAETMEEKVPNVEAKVEDTPVVTPAGKPVETKEQGGRIFASPAARRIARENQVDLSNLRVREGRPRIEAADVLAYIENNKVKMTPLAAKIAKDEGIDPTTLGIGEGKRIFAKDLPKGTNAVEENRTETVAVAEGDRRIKVQGMRKVIASRMKASLDTAAHVTLDIKVDMTEATLLLEKMQPEVMDVYGVKLSLNDIIVKCTAEALAKNPRINSVFEGNEIIEKQDVNVGMAVALQEGLVVPVICNANKLTLGQVASESKRLAKKAKDVGLAPEDMSNGTFTISNLGMYGITKFTSIINQPESAILSVAKVEKQPVVIDDEIAIRPIMNLTLNFDHRPIDGATAAIFLKRLKDLLESPWKILV